MDINNNQQTNTFIKGMDTDTSDMYIGEGSYRYAENLRVVTNKDSNSGELHIIEGTEKVSGHTAKITVDEDNETTPSDPLLLLGFTSIRDYIIEIVKHGNSWSIVRVDKQGNRTLIAGPFNKHIWPDGWDGKTKPLSLVTRWEADDVIKLYIANGKTEMLSINISKTGQQGDFDDIFKVITTSLSPISANKTSIGGAKIPGVVLQYGYIIYNVNGEQSSLSMLSNVVSQSKSAVKGYEAGKYSTNIVALTLPQDILNKRVRVYRVAYSKAGQLPRVDIIYDQVCKITSLYDSGQSLQNIASSEFIATNKLLIIPKEIESKGDYLFAANVTYVQDEIDRQFDLFDARCYSKGNYYGEDVTIWDESLSSLELDERFESLTDVELKHHLFDSNNLQYNANYWKTIDGVNGRGLCFDWKYVYSNDKLYYTKQYDGETPRTYARGEVYRFGVRLFDEQGRASSVKWIADIKMPNAADYTNTDGGRIQDYVTADGDDKDYLLAHNISILFIPRNTNKNYWNGVSKYEIVLARRSIEDSYKITLGIAGYPMEIPDDNGLCLPYFLTGERFNIRRGFSNYDGSGYLNVNVNDDGPFSENVTFRQYNQALVFCSPEYSYQPDDIKNIISEHYSDIFYKSVAVWGRYSQMVTTAISSSSEDSQLKFNAQISYGGTISDSENLHVLKYTDYSNLPDSDLYKLSPAGTDLRVQIGTRNYSSSDVDGDTALGEYFLSSQIMSLYNLDDNTKFTSLSSNSNYKYSYFTNIYAQRLDVVDSEAYEDEAIEHITFVEEQDSLNFAKDGWPTFKRNFSTLNNGKKFYNWTNPVMLSSDIYGLYTGGGDDTTNSWLDTTCTSQNVVWISAKNNWVLSSPGTYRTQRAYAGSYGLSFPISVGGPNMILEIGERGYLSVPMANYHIENGSAMMPPVIVANINKSAVPYGGYNVSAIDNTQYLSFGCCGDKEHSVTMSQGDNYITMFIYYLYHAIDNAYHNSVKTAAVQYIIPIESTMDLSKQCSGYLLATNILRLPITGSRSGFWVLSHPSTLSGRFTQTEDAYMYNTAYSVLPDIVTYAGQNTINVTSPLYDSRIHYSQKKQNNELIDNWTNFKAIDFLDVDSRYGQITGLKLFKDKLVFLQENGAGVLSVNDRIILKDQESANIIVGNGGVLDRYDYFTTMYGMKPEQHAIESSNDALYWWDGHRREIISYVDGYNIALLQRLKNVSNYINSRVDSDTPSIVYDTNNKEVLFNVVKPNSSANGETLVYNEQIQQFTSVYTFSPIYYCNINGEIFLTDNWENGPKLYKYNKLSAGGPLLFGELVYSEWDEDEPAGSNEHEMDDEEEYGREFGDELPIELMAASSPSRSSRPSEEIWSNKALPKLKFVVNKDPIYNKVFDLLTFGGDFYNGDVTKLTFAYNTPLGQSSTTSGTHPITKRECDYRLAIPRDDNRSYGGRMRGKTMECELTSSSNDYDFSIQYVTTKYRMSWS